MIPRFMERNPNRKNRCSRGMLACISVEVKTVEIELFWIPYYGHVPQGFSTRDRSKLVNQKVLLANPKRLRLALRFAGKNVTVYTPQFFRRFGDWRQTQGSRLVSPVPIEKCHGNRARRASGKRPPPLGQHPGSFRSAVHVPHKNDMHLTPDSLSTGQRGGVGCLLFSPIRLGKNSSGPAGL